MTDLNHNLAFRAERPSYIVLLQGAVAVVGFLIAVYTIYWVSAHHYVMPVNDDIYDRTRFIRARPSWSNFFSYLIAPHNEHRIATTRAIALLDDYFLRGKEQLQVGLCVFLQVVMAVISVVVLTSEDNERGNFAKYVFPFGVIIVLFVNPMFLYTFAIQFQIQHTLMATLVVGLAAWMSMRIETTPSSREFAAFVAATFVLAVLATFTLGNAPVLLMTCAGMAVLARWPLKFTAVLTLLAIAHVGLTLLTKEAATHDGIASVLDLVKFALIYLGAPFIRFGPWPSSFATWSSSVTLTYLLGVAIFGIFSAAVMIRLARPRFGGRAMSFGIFVLTCIIITAFAGAYSRAGFGVLEGANKKYASFAALGWLGALAICIGMVRELCARRVILGVTAVYLAAAAVVFSMSIDAGSNEMRVWQKAADKNAESSIAVLFKVNSDALLHDLYPDPPAASEYFHDIERRNLSVFSRYAIRWGDDMAVRFTGYKETVCKGEVERFDPIAPGDLTKVFDAPGAPFTMRGWAWMTESHAPASYVVTVDEANRIVGFALSTRVSERAEEWLSQKFSGNLGWYGLARLTDTGPAHFYAVSEASKEYCTINR